MNGRIFICNKHVESIKTDGITIFEDDFVYVGHIDNNENPGYLGHLMIDLKRHVPTLGDMTLNEAKAFGCIMARVSKALMISEKAEHIYSFVSGNTVPHLHMHVVPRYPDTPKQFWGPMSVREWPEAPLGGETEVKELCLRIKSYLETQGHE
ncbi:HIT domain-containing protein [Sporosarcina limicola]|uniref:Diadenosine tetraphosphate (Ap4A) HIT family hydrolase n=1 Tax=Sporosarcina limicola TaxID=34101 RepID=A0A927R2R0_9BACL|nr:diadenosine tetraphosphate (Ap4A) HIT family hydrolase [Sporosarcina limicola]